MSTPAMLAGPGGASRWVNEDIDALPYADELPEGWRADVDRLVQEEMRRMKKRPKDYLEEMAPAREIDWSGCPLLEKAFARVAEGKGGLDRPDGARYELAPPPKNKRNDEKAWEVAVKNARAQLEHQTLRVQNLELAAKFAPAAWRAHNAHLETNISRYERLLSETRAEIADINTKRSLQQSSAGSELKKLEEEWYAVSAKCFAVDAAAKALEAKRDAIASAGAVGGA